MLTCLVLGMPGEVPQLVDTVSKLALLAVLAGSTLLVGPTQLWSNARLEFSEIPEGNKEGNLKAVIRRNS